MIFGSILEALPVDIHRCVDHFGMIFGSILEALPVEIHGFLDHFGMIFGSLLEALAVQIHRFLNHFWIILNQFWRLPRCISIDCASGPAPFGRGPAERAGVVRTRRCSPN